jgi:hypothetical protein
MASDKSIRTAFIEVYLRRLVRDCLNFPTLKS